MMIVKSFIYIEILGTFFINEWLNLFAYVGRDFTYNGFGVATIKTKINQTINQSAILRPMLPLGNHKT